MMPALLEQRPAQRTSRYVTAMAEAGDDAEIRALLRATPMAGRVRLSLQREPNAFIAEAICGRPSHTVTVRDTVDQRLLGVGSRSVKDVWRRGAPARVGYLGRLRRVNDMVGYFRLIRGAFEALERTRRVDELPFDITSVAADNAPARRFLERGARGLPRYQPYGEYHNVTLTVPRRARSAMGVGGADRETMPRIADFLHEHWRDRPFAPRCTAAMLVDRQLHRGLQPSDWRVLRQGDRVIGCAALWDQSAFRQVVVDGYEGALQWGRPMLNAVRWTAGLPTLPPRGRPLVMAFASYLAVDGDDTERMLQLLSALVHDAGKRRIDYLTLNLPAGSPWFEPITTTYRCHVLPHVLYTVHPAGVDARIERDDQPFHLEAATL